MSQSRESPPRVDAAANAILAAIRRQVGDLRALTLGLGVVTLLIWIAGVFEGLSFASRFCCRPGLVLILEFGGAGVLSALVTTALLVASVAIWTARSRESRALGEEWSTLANESDSLLLVHLLERAGAWRDGLRRNFEASVVTGVLLPVMVFILVFSIAVASPPISPPMAWVITIGLTLGCGIFAVLQVGAIFLSVRRTRSEIDRQRLAALRFLGGQGGLRTGPGFSAVEDSRPTGVADRDLVEVERALLGKEEMARRTAGTERFFAAVLVAAAAVALLSMATASAWSLTNPPAATPYAYGATYSDGGAGIVLALVGFVGVLWASAILLRGRSAGRGNVAESVLPSPTGPALSSLDEAVEQLDRARSTAGRGRNAVVLTAVLVVTRFWFTPTYYNSSISPLGIANVFLSNLALPLALFIVLWTAYRLDRMENLQTELHRWVLALVRLELAFWERY